MNRQKRAWDTGEWFTTTELIERGWARQWVGLLLGQPIKSGSAKLWPKRQALEIEAHPIFVEASARLAGIAQSVAYVTKEHELAALRVARARFVAGELPPAAVAIDIAPIVDPVARPVTEFPKAQWSQDALAIVWECGGRVVIP